MAVDALIVPSTASGPAAIAPGHGRLRIGRVDGHSAATSVQAASPLKLLVPRPRGPSVWAYTSSFGGGLLPGDDIRLEVELDAGTRCFLGSQASTKVYRNPSGCPCRQTLSARLGEDSLFVLAPEPVQTFAGALYAQRQCFHLGLRASLVLVDWCCGGRVARGERWAFNRFSSRNEIFHCGERVFLDSLLLDPAQGPPGAPHRMGRYNCLALLVLAGDGLKDAGKRVLKGYEDRPVDSGPEVITSASSIACGVLVRIAGAGIERVAAELRGHLKFLEARLGDDPLKRNSWGNAAL